MAAFNSTETTVTAGSAASSAGLLNMPELEKISCSIKGKTFIHPLGLMGRRIRFAETVLSEVGLSEGDPYESILLVGTVLSVNLGSIRHGIETSLLVQVEDGSYPYYVDISALTVLDVFPPRAS